MSCSFLSTVLENIKNIQSIGNAHAVTWLESTSAMLLENYKGTLNSACKEEFFDTTLTNFLEDKRTHTDYVSFSSSILYS